jgi:hypothetical protein
LTAGCGPAVGLRRIRRVSTAGVTALAGAEFAMSYGALHALARDSGVPPTLAWLWPLVVDGFIVVASLSVLHAVLEARSAAYPWALLLLFAAVSVAGNVAHGAPTPVGRLVAAVPPVALVLAFDLLMRQVRRVLDPAQATTSPVPWVRIGADESVSVPRSGESVDQRVPSLRLARPTVAGQAARLVARRRAAGMRVTGSWLARELHVSEGYARRLLRQLDPPADDAHGFSPVEVGLSR